MPLHQTPPGRGGRRAHVHFIHQKTAHGKTWPAWIAGPCHWYECHTKGRSKPCLHDITGGELTCELCSPFDVPQALGYQPLYNKADGRPCFCVVHDYARDQIDALRLHHPVHVSRGDGASDTVAIVPLLGTAPKYTSTVAERMKPADLTESLLRIWKIPALIEWYRVTQGVNITSPPTPPTPPTPLTRRKREDGKPFTPMMQAAANKYQFPEVAAEEAGLDDALDRIKAREAAAKPSSNGKH